jgi:hypothetical protein
MARPLEEVGARFGVTRERVHQIFREAGIRLRSEKETAALRRERLLRHHRSWSGTFRQPFSRASRRHSADVFKQRADWLSSGDCHNGVRQIDNRYIRQVRQGASYRRWLAMASFQTHTERFGGWRKALERAEVNRPPARATLRGDEASRD